jgi:hypothetical protein
VFGLEVVFFNPMPEEEIRRLRQEGHSLAEVANRTETTIRRVRRLVGKVDQAAARQRQEDVARSIDAEDLTWGEKVKKWKEQTGQSEATFWRVLQRIKGTTKERRPE